MMSNNTLSRLGMLAIAAAVCFSAAETKASVVIDAVLVGNPGNLADTTGNGAVGYDYLMGKYEVTNAQYAEFLNNVATASDPFELYHVSMGIEIPGGITRTESSGVFSYSVKPNMGDKPVNYVSWFDGARFTNWICNGQGSSSTETGAYTISGGTASATHSPTAQFWIPTLDEWYKAAYYDPAKSGAAGYWVFPTKSDVAPTKATAGLTGNISNPGSNVANHSSGAVWNGPDANVTTVGSAGVLSASAYGTYDQGGNVWEWNEALDPSLSRGLGGGGFGNSADSLSSTGTTFFDPTSNSSDYGFRLAAAVPEPSVAGLLLLAVVAAAVRRCRRAL